MTEKNLIKAQGNEAVTPTAILGQAYANGAPIEELTKLLELQEKYERREAEKAFNVALAEFKADAPKIIKDKSVSFGDTAYKHASLANVVYTISERLSEYGLSHKWETQQNDNYISVKCVLSHKLGHSASVQLSAPADNSGKKNAIQSIGSTVSYLQRYTLLAITGLAADDHDDDGRGSGVQSDYITFEQVQDLETLVAELGGDLGKICEYYQVSSPNELPAEKYQTIVTSIRTKAKNKASK